MPDLPQIELLNDAELLVVWPEQSPSLLSYSLIRRACTCASCRRQRPKGSTLLGAEQVAQVVRVLRFETVGAYAVRFVFSDLHRGGLYSWEILRELAGASE